MDRRPTPHARRHPTRRRRPASSLPRVPRITSQPPAPDVAHEPDAPHAQRDPHGPRPQTAPPGDVCARGNADQRERPHHGETAQPGAATGEYRARVSPPHGFRWPVLLGEEADVVHVVPRVYAGVAAHQSRPDCGGCSWGSGKGAAGIVLQLISSPSSIGFGVLGWRKDHVILEMVFYGFYIQLY